MRRKAKAIYIVSLTRWERDDSTEEWQAEVRFTTERAASVFAKKAERLNDIDSIVGPSPGPLWYSGSAAYEDLRDELGANRR